MPTSRRVIEKRRQAAAESENLLFDERTRWVAVFTAVLVCSLTLNIHADVLWM